MSNVEKKISKIFDFQRFDPNEELSRVISETKMNRKIMALSDDDLGFVAAGVSAKDNAAKIPFCCPNCKKTIYILQGIHTGICTECSVPFTISG